jgi:small subunit ribosomal protein S8
MAMNDTLAAMLSHLRHCDALGRRECIVKPVSKLSLEIFKILQDKRYIGSFEVIEDGKGGHVIIQLIGRINNCGVVKPRFSVKKGDFVRFEKRYLPAKDFGMLFVSTSKGVLTHEAAFKEGVGGKLLAYCY